MILMPEINPTGSPMGEVSISCWTTCSARAICPMDRLSDRVPATPLLMIQSGAYFRIMVWAHMAAKTLPMPHLAQTTRFPQRSPYTKVILPTVSVSVFSMAAQSASTSICMAPMIPISAFLWAVVFMLLPPLCVEYIQVYCTTGGGICQGKAVFFLPRLRGWQDAIPPEIGHFAQIVVPLSMVFSRIFLQEIFENLLQIQEKCAII